MIYLDAMLKAIGFFLIPVVTALVVVTIGVVIYRVRDFYRLYDVMYVGSWSGYLRDQWGNIVRDILAFTSLVGTGILIALGILFSHQETAEVLHFIFFKC